jgi:hypothetical protein
VATLLARADGLLSAAATWALAHATGLLDSQAGNSAVPTGAGGTSAAFTPDAVTIDGVAVKVASRVTSPSGTLTIDLVQGGVQVAGTAVVINVSDLPSCVDTPSTTFGCIGWTFLKFAAPVALAAATAYNVRAIASVASEVNLFRDATANNWSRLLRVSTAAAAAPVAGDRFFVLGEWTGAGALTSRAVTMDSTAATDFGDGVITGVPSVGISKGGTLSFGVVAATAYILQINGRLEVWAGGVLEMGTAAAPTPVDSSHTLQFNAGADAQMGVSCFGTFTREGVARTAGKDVFWTKLNTDEAAGQTVLGVAADTGWLNADVIAIASTSRTSTQAESRVLNGNAGATTVTVTAGLTNAHSGTSPTEAEVILLTRNNVLKSVAAAHMIFCRMFEDSVIRWRWAQTAYCSSTQTAYQFASEHQTTSAGSFDVQYCSFHAFEGPVSLTKAGLTAWVGTFSYNVAYDVCNVAASGGVDFSATSTGAWSIRGNVLLLCGNSGLGGFLFRSFSGIFTDNICASCPGYGVYILTTVGAPYMLAATWSSNEAHSNGVGGFRIAGLSGFTVNGGRAWRNQVTGLEITASNTPADQVTVKNCDAFGNGSRNLWISSAQVGLVRLRSCSVESDAAYTTPRGVELAANYWGPLYLESCTFGQTLGHTTADVYFQTGGNLLHEVFLINTVLASATEFGNITSLGGRSAIHHQRVDGVTGVHKTYFPALGTVSLDTTEFRTLAPSQKLAPVGATSVMRLQTARKQANVALGNRVSLEVYILKNVAYAGSAPRLVFCANGAIGNPDDTELAVSVEAAGAYERLSGITDVVTEDGVAEFLVEADGSAGAVWVDDWRRL